VHAGKTEKIYGWVIYTKGNSPTFYSHDLDQETGLKDASTSQVWGRRGADKLQALSLGFVLRRRHQQEKEES
jgi:hypothetical protein